MLPSERREHIETPSPRPIRFRERLVFMHIHKTAGTSLAHQLFSRCDPSDICPARFEFQILATPPSELARYTIFHGHLSPNPLAVLAGPMLRITMLREPKVRLLSAFFYWRMHIAAQPSHPFFSRLADMTIVEFLESSEPIIRGATWNAQARLIAGGSFGSDNEHRTNVIGPDLPPSELGDAAVRGLQNFDLVGIAERYDETLDRACRLLGTPTPPVETHNEGGAIPCGGYQPLLADPRIAGALERLTEIDAHVYAEAMSRFSGGADVSASRL